MARLAWAHPWILMLLMLVVGLAIAVICGLASQEAQTWLLVGLGILGVGCLLIYAWHKERLSKGTVEKSRHSLTKSIGGVAAGLLLLFLTRGWMQNSGLDGPAQRPTVSASRKADLERRLDNAEMLAAQPNVAKATEQYWRSSVANLQPHLFGFAPDPKEDALRLWRQRLEQLRVAISQAENSSTRNVDAELVAMAGSHLDTAKAYLERQDRLCKATADLASSPQDRAALERLGFDDLVERVFQASQAGKLAPGIAEEWNMTPGDNEKLDRMFQETELMQVTLSERYKSDNASFTLPAFRAGNATVPAP